MSKQHVLEELKQFMQAVGNRKKLISSTQIRTSLRLLEDCPAAREVIFDYFALVAEVAVQSYVNTTNIDPGTGLPMQQSKNNAIPPSPEALEENSCFTLIQETLENLINKGPPDWGPVIAVWSLDVVGNLSDKYTRRKTSIGANCNFWLNCEAMRGLLTLISLSFRKLNNEDAESCVLKLLNVFQRCPLTFDWAVARLGGCFPQEIITQILQCSLKRFAEDFHAGFDSEIGILDYLSFAHEQELKTALKEMLHDGFEPKRGIDATIVPFLMVISNYSDVLLQNLTTVFLNMYNDDIRNTIIQKTPLWMSNKRFFEMQPSLNNVALRLSSHGVKILIGVSKMAEDFSWCQDFLEYTLQEFEQIILNARSCPIMYDLATENTKYMLWKSCLSTNIYEQQTAVRLLLIVSTQHSHIYYQTISELLRKSYDLNRNGIGAVIRMIGGHAGVVEFPDIKPGLQMVFEDVLLQEQFQHSRLAASSEEAYNTFKNLNTLTKMQSKNSLPHLRTQPLNAVLQECLPKILQILDVTLTKLVLQGDLRDMKNNNNSIDALKDTKMSDHLSKIRVGAAPGELGGRSKMLDHECHEKEYRERLKLANTIIDLLNTLEAGSVSSVIRTTEVLKLAILSVKYFFVTLSQPDTVTRSTAIEHAFVLLRRQCSARKAARSACLRELVEGSLFYYGWLFSQFEEPFIDPLEIPEHEMIMKQNQRHTAGTNANRYILHAGVIGRGIRQNCYTALSTNDCDQDTQHLFLKALDCCCTDSDKQNVIEGYAMISLLLVELVSTDVMYNGLPFPDEEFTKVTMERDLMIRRAFNTSPILWGLLGFIATHRPALCFSSVLLRALCATCLHQWRAKNVHKFQTVLAQEDLMECTKKLLRILAVGQLLPPPLSNLHAIIEHFEPSEIALLLKECVWNYMKDHVPSPALFQVDSNGLNWRNPSTSKVPSKYVDTLRCLMQKKLTKMGEHYHQMFVMSDAYESKCPTPIPVTDSATTMVPIEIDCTDD